jgi:hypothetical protein
MMTASERVYRMLLRAYPAGFRREYEAPMLQHFRDQLRAAAGAREWLGLWLRTATDLVRTLPLCHLENWLPHHGNFRFEGEALQAIFFARYEASSFGRSEITLEHLLLGVLRQDQALRSALAGREEEARRRIEAMESDRRRTPPTEDLPLSEECRTAIQGAIEEANDCAEPRVRTPHLIRAILKQESTLAAHILRDCGFGSGRG